MRCFGASVFLFFLRARMHIYKGRNLLLFVILTHFFIILHFFYKKVVLFVV